MLITMFVMLIGWMDVPLPLQESPVWLEVGVLTLQVSFYLLTPIAACLALFAVWLTGHPVTLITGHAFVAFMAPAPDIGQMLIQVHTVFCKFLLFLVFAQIVVMALFRRHGHSHLH